MKINTGQLRAHLVVHHPTAELLGLGPDHLGVVPGPGVEGVGVDGLTVEAGISDLVVPVLGGVGLLALYGGLVLLLGVGAPVRVLADRRPVQLLSAGVVTELEEGQGEMRLV